MNLGRDRGKNEGIGKWKYLAVISSLVPLLEEFDLERPFRRVRDVPGAESGIRRVRLQSGGEDVPVSNPYPSDL